MLSMAGRVVSVEQRDPTMGPNSRLDVVEFPSDFGGPASHDVSVHTVFRADPAFVGKCAEQAGHAASEGAKRKLDHQYKDRLPGSSLLPISAEVGGRWHPSVVGLVRRLARDYVARTPGLDPSAQGAVVSRWGARLSAILIRGNAAVVRACIGERPTAPHVDVPGAAALAHLLPEGDCAYELGVESGWREDLSQH